MYWGIVFFLAIDNFLSYAQNQIGSFTPFFLAIDNFLSYAQIKLVPSLLFYQKRRIESKIRIRKSKERGVPASLLLYSVLCPHGIPLGKCAVHRFDDLIWLIVFDFGVNIHRNFAALMARQVLHRFGVHRRMNQVGYVGVSELVGSDLEIQAVNTVTVVPGLLS